MNIVDKLLESKKAQFWLFFTVLIALSVFMIRCYSPLHPGIDYFFHIHRFTAIIDAMNNGTFPIYIDYESVNGYGYLAKVFYSDFVLIPFAIIGMYTNAIVGYQSMLFAMTVLCGLFTYMAVNKVYKNALAASVSAILYTFCIYRLFDLYSRAALGEALSFTFIPLVFLGLYHIIRGDYKKWYILAIGYSLMIFTHVISSVLMLVTISIFVLIYNKSLRKEPKRIIYLLVAAAATCILVAYYILPMLEQTLNYSFFFNTHQIMGRAHDGTLGIHWIMWGLFSGGVQPRQIILLKGIGFLLVASICLRLFVQGRSKEIRSADTMVVVGIIFLISINHIFPWRHFPFNLLGFIQYPWRLYEFISFLFAVAGGYYFSQAFTSFKRTTVACVLILVSTTFVMVSDAELYKTTRNYRSLDEVAHLDNSYHIGGMEYLPAKSDIGIVTQRSTDSVSVQYTSTQISNIIKQKGILSFEINTQQAESVTIPLLYYKGYTTKLNGNKIHTGESEQGLVQIKPKESGKVVVYYEGTNIQKVSVWISMLGIIALIVYIIMENRKKKASID